jgi:hypothetical protein
MATASCMAVHAPVTSPASARQIDNLCKLVARVGSKRGGLAWARRRLRRRGRHERACGYSHGAVKIYRADDGWVIKVPCTVEYPPDTTAASLWLRNRQPRLWRDKHEIDVADAGESMLDDMRGPADRARHDAARDGAEEAELMSIRKFDAATGDAQRRCAHRPCAQPLPARPRANQPPTHGDTAQRDAGSPTCGRGRAPACEGAV